MEDGLSSARAPTHTHRRTGARVHRDIGRLPSPLLPSTPFLPPPSPPADRAEGGGDGASAGRHAVDAHGSEAGLRVCEAGQGRRVDRGNRIGRRGDVVDDRHVAARVWEIVNLRKEGEGEGGGGSTTRWRERACLVALPLDKLHVRARAIGTKPARVTSSYLVTSWLPPETVMRAVRWRAGGAGGEGVGVAVIARAPSSSGRPTGGPQRCYMCAMAHHLDTLRFASDREASTHSQDGAGRRALHSRVRPPSPFRKRCTRDLACDLGARRGDGPRVQAADSGLGLAQGGGHGSD